SFAFAPEGFEIVQIERVEALADMEEEHAENDEGDHDRERHAHLHYERHAAHADGGQDQAVLQRHEADHLGDGVAPGDHHQKPERDDRKRQRQVLARDGARLIGHRQHEQYRERNQPDPDDHGEADAEHGLDGAVDLQLDDDVMEGDRNRERLEDEG